MNATAKNTLVCLFMICTNNKSPSHWENHYTHNSLVPLQYFNPLNNSPYGKQTIFAGDKNVTVVKSHHNYRPQKLRHALFILKESLLKLRFYFLPRWSSAWFIWAMECRETPHYRLSILTHPHTLTHTAHMQRYANIHSHINTLRLYMHAL